MPLAPRFFSKIAFQVSPPSVNILSMNVCSAVSPLARPTPYFSVVNGWPTTLSSSGSCEA